MSSRSWQIKSHDYILLSFEMGEGEPKLAALREICYCPVFWTQGEFLGSHFSSPWMRPYQIILSSTGIKVAFSALFQHCPQDTTNPEGCVAVFFGDKPRNSTALEQRLWKRGFEAHPALGRRLGSLQNWISSSWNIFADTEYQRKYVNFALMHSESYTDKKTLDSTVWMNTWVFTCIYLFSPITGYFSWLRI